MTCPTCGAEVGIVVNDQCHECAEGQVAEWIDNLQPKGE